MFVVVLLFVAFMKLFLIFRTWYSLLICFKAAMNQLPVGYL